MINSGSHKVSLKSHMKEAEPAAAAAKCRNILTSLLIRTRVDGDFIHFIFVKTSVDVILCVSQIKNQ